MTTASTILLWSIVTALSLTVLALARQVGVLHERVAPVGALVGRAGPRVGQHAPPITVQTLSGNAVTIGASLSENASLLMLFVSNSCPICKKLISVAQDFARSESLQVLFVGDDRIAEQEALMRQFSIEPDQFINGPELGLAYGIDKLPHAILLNGNGRIAARGLVNSREHLESLVIADQTGFDSLQSYLRTRASGSAA